MVPTPERAFAYTILGTQRRPLRIPQRHAALLEWPFAPTR